MKAGLGKPAKVKKPAKKPAKAKSAASASLGKDKKTHQRISWTRPIWKSWATWVLQIKWSKQLEEGDTTEEQAVVLKGLLKKDEHSKVWGRYSTHLDKNPEEKKEVEQLSKKDKGLKAAQWLMQIEGKKIFAYQKSCQCQPNCQQAGCLGKLQGHGNPVWRRWVGSPPLEWQSHFQTGPYHSRGVAVQGYSKLVFQFCSQQRPPLGARDRDWAWHWGFGKVLRAAWKQLENTPSNRPGRLLKGKKLWKRQGKTLWKKQRERKRQKWTAGPLKTKRMKRLKKMSPKMLWKRQERQETLWPVPWMIWRRLWERLLPSCQGKGRQQQKAGNCSWRSSWQSWRLSCLEKSEANQWIEEGSGGGCQSGQRCQRGNKGTEGFG